MPDLDLLADHPDDDPEAALVRAEALAPGTPEELWWCVGTGAGIGTWFVPARLQGRVGGTIVTEHGSFGYSHGVVTAFDPPHRFAYEERAWGTDVPPWRTELVVEPVAAVVGGGDGGPAGGDARRSGGPTPDAGPGDASPSDDRAPDGTPAPGPVCRVRVTSGLTEEGERWRHAVEVTAEGWVAGMRNLRLARTHFPGQEAGGIFVTRGTRAPAPDAWAALLAALGASGATVGDEVTAPAGAPALRGVVEEIRPSSLLLRTTAPAPGLVELSAHEWSTPTLFVHGHLYGPAGAVVAEAERPRWDAWLHARFAGARPD